MKRIRRDRIAVISEKSPGLFEAAINNRLDELAEYKPELVIESIKDNTAFIRYTIDEYIPESLADKCELLGVKYHCEDCLYCTLKRNADGTIDRRAKKSYCEKGKKATWIHAEACDVYYFELISGTGQFKRGGGIPENAKKILNKESRQKLLTSTEFEIAADHHADR